MVMDYGKHLQPAMQVMFLVKLLLEDWYPEKKPKATYSNQEFSTQWINLPYISSTLQQN